MVEGFLASDNLTYGFYAVLGDKAELAWQMPKVGK